MAATGATSMEITQTEIAKAQGTSNGTEVIITKRRQLRSDRSVVQNAETIALILGMILEMIIHKILEGKTSGKMKDRM